MLCLICDVFFGFVLSFGTGNLNHASVHGMKYARDFEDAAFLRPFGLFSESSMAEISMDLEFRTLIVCGVTSMRKKDVCDNNVI